MSQRGNNPGGRKKTIIVALLGFMPERMFHVLHDHLGLTCYHCEGSGHEPCPDCGGFGAGYIGESMDIITCDRCKGKGYLKMLCSLCGGSKNVRNG